MTSEQEVATIPLAEERVVVGKRSVETGRLRVRVSVTEREELVPVTLAHDTVEVSRVRRNLTITELPGVRVEGDITIIPVVEEVVVVEKRLVLVEEIHIRRSTGTEERQVPVKLRSETASIEHGGGSVAAPSSRGGA